MVCWLWGFVQNWWTKCWQVNLMYLDKINMLLDTYTPLKRINKYKMKFKSKPWVTLGLQKSISVKNKLLKSFINKKDYIKRRILLLLQKNIETYSPPLWRKVNRLIMINILKEIGIVLRTHGEELNPFFL